MRTAWILGGVLGSMTVEMLRADAASPATAEGLARVRARCRRALDRLGVRVEVTGVERVPASGGLIFMWNQTSHLDHPLLPLAIPRPFFLTYNNELRRFPIYGRYLERGGHFWLDRTSEEQWRIQVERAAARVRDGACVLISPEGTRSWDGRLLPMKRGAFLLARASGRPIVCVTVSGARDLLPRGRVAVRPGRVQLEVSAPIDSTGPALEETVKRTFEEALVRATSGTRPDRSSPRA